MTDGARGRIGACRVFAWMVIIWAFPVAQVLASSFFCGDPLPDACSSTSGSYVYGTFMRVDAISQNNYLHTGIDLCGCDYDIVCPPIVGDDSAVVDDGSFLYKTIALIPNRPSITQEGSYVGCYLLHVMPSGSLQVGSIVVPLQIIGTLDVGYGHLHEEISLGTTYHGPWASDANLVNPLTHANEGALWDDTEPPVIDSVRVDSVSVPTAWKWRIFARDEFTPHADLDDNNGLYRATLEVNGQIVDSFWFDRYVNKTGTGLPSWDEFYCTQNTSRLCYKLTWNRGLSEALESWTVIVWDAGDMSDGEDWPDPECLGQCDTWGCIKACYGEGGYSRVGAVASGWPSPLGCASGAELCYPQGVFGKMGGYQLYWPDFDPGAWTYDAWESADDESSYRYLGTSSTHQGYNAIARPNAAMDSTYCYSVASLDSVFRDEVPRPGKGSIIGIGQCRLTNVPYCAELDTVNAVLFVGESEGIVDVVDVSIPEAPQILATYDLSEYGLWQNTFDDICVLRYGGEHLWVVCGNKGVAILQFASDYQAMVVRGRYAIPGWRLSLYGSVQMEPLGGESAPPDESHYYAYYVTTECKVRVLDFVRGGGGYPHIECCGEYEDSLSSDYVAIACHALGPKDAPVLYVTGYRFEPSLSGGLSVVDISVPCEPTFVREIDTYSATGYEARVGSSLYVLGPPERTQEMTVFDVSDPYLPVEQASWSNALFNHDANCNPLGPGRIACSDDRVYFIGNAYVAYPTPNRYGGCACWGGLECFTMCGDAFPMFSAAVTDTGFDMAGDTSLVTTTVTADLGKIYMTYTCDADTNGVPENARNRLKIYTDLYQDGGEAGVTTHWGQTTACDVSLRLTGPNPFADWTAVSFSVPEVSRAELAVYDVRGRRVRTLADSELLPGVYDLEWDGRNARGGRVSPGIYFLHLQIGKSRLTCKAILLK